MIDSETKKRKNRFLFQYLRKLFLSLNDILSLSMDNKLRNAKIEEET